MSCEKTSTFVDKATWPAGPWRDEPDKVQWIDDATGLDCLIVRNPDLGNLCGYVGVPPGHALHGREYEYLSERVDAHGGVTFGGACHDRICHTPEPGRPEHVWWIGFDCGHLGDLVPNFTLARSARRDPLLSLMGMLSGFDEDSPEDIGGAGFGETYRDIDYVRGQCAELAAQIAALPSQPEGEAP